MGNRGLAVRIRQGARAEDELDAQDRTSSMTMTFLKSPPSRAEASRGSSQSAPRSLNKTRDQRSPVAGLKSRGPDVLMINPF